MQPNPQRVRQRAIVLLALLVCGAFLLALIYREDRTSNPENLLSLARMELAQGNYQQAEDLALKIPSEHALFAESCLVAGEAALKGERLSNAIKYYGAVPQNGSDISVDAAMFLGEAYRKAGILSRAQECYVEVLKHRPDHIGARKRLAFLLAATGQRWEALDHYLELVRQRAWSVDELVILGDQERPLEQGEWLHNCWDNASFDALVQAGLAAHASEVLGDSAQAKRLLQRVLIRNPDLLSHQALLGELCSRGTEAIFSSWHEHLPSDAGTHPNVWFVRGLWLRKQGELQAAAHCFWETIKLSPNHRRAHFQLGQLLILLGEAGGEEFTHRGERLGRLSQLLNQILRVQGRNETDLKQTAFLLKDLGRAWEAWAWATTAQRFFPSADWPIRLQAELSPLLTETTPRTLAKARLTSKYDLSHFERPSMQQLFGRSEKKRNAIALQASGDPIVFDDEAAPAGLAFTYFDGDDDPDEPGARTFQQTGGGVGVLDFDLDAWPDLYFTQGAPWPEGSNVPAPDREMLDRLFRNVEGRRFEDVTRQAGLFDADFGQGLAVGDYDNDGFPDLYVANIGRNRLYRNNGDGTFTDVTVAGGLQLSKWTSSCVIVDLNADGMPDLFDANYLTGKGVFLILCNGEACGPGSFLGEPDSVLISNQQGQFEHLPNATPTQDSKGLGLVAFDFKQRGRPSLFIANDQVANFFLKNQTSETPPYFRFENDGLLSGLAFNQEGIPYACMGIAAADADNNGYIDFFVTNFEGESNTLYLQDESGMFSDSTQIARLSQPSYSYVGWGTQFLDANLDSFQDIVLVNGHVDNYKSKEVLYRMPSQLFRNLGDCRFEEQKSDVSGSYFQRKYRGRGLAKLDWNGDGRMDFVVSNIHTPASLATNRSQAVGHYLIIRLHATRTARDAIGTEVHVQAGRNSWTQQLVAGDGYMASNERVLQFGLGRIQSVDEVTIQWPSGNQLVLRDPPVDATLDLVEGADVATVWRKHVPDSLRLSP